MKKKNKKVLHKKSSEGKLNRSDKKEKVTIKHIDDIIYKQSEIIISSGKKVVKEKKEIVSPEEKDEKDFKNDVEIEAMEKKIKTYWSKEVEDAVRIYLTYDSNWYLVKMEKFIKRRAKNNVDLFESLKNVEEEDERMSIIRKFLPEQDIEYIKALKNSSNYANNHEIIDKKHKIFNSVIRKAINKLVENIMFTYRLFKPGEDIRKKHDDCVTFLYMKFSNFMPTLNTKSFSYFGTMAKHYLQECLVDEAKFLKNNMNYDGNKEQYDDIQTTSLTDKTHEEEREGPSRLLNFVIKEIEKEINSGKMSTNDIKVGGALCQIFRNHEILGIYNKNYLYQLLKENTNMETKDITYSIQRFKSLYKFIKEDFITLDSEE